MTEIYQKLSEQAEVVKGLHLRELFNNDSQRFEKFHIKWGDFLFDYSKKTDAEWRILVEAIADMAEEKYEMLAKE